MSVDPGDRSEGHEAAAHLKQIDEHLAENEEELRKLDEEIREAERKSKYVLRNRKP